MKSIETILETAHITLTTATLKVAVSDLSNFKVLLNPEKTLIGNVGVPVYAISSVWQKEMGFPSYVLDVSPNWNDGTLNIWVTDGFDFKEISDWLKKIEQ